MEKSLDSPSKKQLEEKINQLERRVKREKEARKSAESILESKSLDLFSLNQNLASLNAQLEAQLDQNKQFLQSINDFSGYLVGKTDLSEIASIITKKLISKYDLEDCVIYKVEDGFCYQVSAFGVDGDRENEILNPIKLKVGEGIVGSVAKTGKVELVHDTSKDHRYIPDGKIRYSELTVPIEFEGSVIGVIDTEHSQKGFFTLEHGQTITTIARLISVIFKNSLTEQRNLNLETGIEKRTGIINSLVQNLHSGLLLNDENGKIVLVSDVFRDILKLKISSRELIGRDQGELADLLKHLFSDPQGFIEFVDHSHEHNQNVSRKELELIDGTILDCDFIPIYAKDEFIGQLWQISDVTSSRTYQKKIEASEEKYRGIIENMELGLLEVDLDHKILKAYEWFCLMTGYSEKELLGQDARMVFLPDAYNQLMNEQDQRRVKGEQSIYEVQMKKKNGDLIWVLISGAPFYDQDGNIIGTIGIHYNIDRRKKLEEDLKHSKLQTEKAMAAEKQFLANMSHEIRNPLNAIIGITNLLYDTRPSNEQLNHLNNIKYSSDILLGLISGVLDISKIESGTLQLAEKEVDIHDIVNGLIQLAGFNLRDKQIKYINRLPSTGEFTALADSTVLNQIFLNLLSNATKFTETGSIQVEGKILESNPDFIHFEFNITDTGIGIPKDKLDSIFNIFEQADHETKLKYGGTGLGLSIVKKLVKMYQGDIRAEGNLGEGTTVIFNLKLKTASKNIHLAKKVEYEAKAERRILVVEDNQINQYYLSGILNKWKIDHDIANDGNEALEAITKKVYNLILMDIRMPVMDGYEATIKLRSMKHNQNCTTPIIALTASALVDEREKALQAGMNYHLTKPYTAEELGKALAEFGIIKEIESNNTPLYKFSSQLDQEYLKNYYQDDLERAHTLFEIFNRMMDAEYHNFLTSIETNDWNAVASIAHKIKPNFAMVGLMDLYQLMDHYENVKINIEIRNEIKLNISELNTQFSTGKAIVQNELVSMKKYLEL